MQTVSVDFGEAIRAKNRKLEIRCEIQTPDQSIYSMGAEGLAQGGFSYRASCMQHDFELGGCTAASCTLILANYGKQWDDIDLEGGKLVVYCGVETGVDEEDTPVIEHVLMGTFVIQRQSRPYATITLEGADRLILLDKPLGEALGITYPVTARTLLNAVSGACGVPLDNSLLDIDELDEIELNEPGYPSFTCRDALGEIALLCGGFARCTREGAIEIVRLEPLNALTAYEMGVNDRFSYRETTEPITLTGIKYGDNLIGEEGYVLEVEPLALVSEDSALEHLQAVWGALDGFSYVPCEVVYTGNPAIDTADAVLHTTRDGREVLTFVGRHGFTFGGRCELASYGKSKSEQAYVSANARRLSGLIENLENRVTNMVTQYGLAAAQMSDMVGLMMGVFPSQEVLPDGSTTYFWHNKPTRAESDIIWMLNGAVFVTSSDGGNTWTGQTADGTVLARQLIAEGALIGSAGSDYATTIRPNSFSINYHGMPVMTIIEDEIRAPKIIANEYFGISRIKFVPAFEDGVMVGTDIVFVDDPTEI